MITLISIQLLLILLVVNQFHICQGDFVITYSQTPIKHYLYIKFPKGVYTNTGNIRTHVLNLVKNLYSKNQSGELLNKYLPKKLLTIGFKQLAIGGCVLFQGCFVFT